MAEKVIVVDDDPIILKKH
ncbi:hypothetical protein CIY_16390 [Butyrivibrio fibrisolvens 16/4]|nr:hypothetical protein CIY_16390 [Butyrivibrio fibrisolvens 16/4]